MKFAELTKDHLAVKNEDQFDLLLATTDIGLWEFDLKSQTGLRNLRHDQIFGYETLQPEWNFEIFLGFVVEEERQRVVYLLEEAQEKGQSWAFDTRIKALDGSSKWISARGVPKFSKQGEMEKIVGHVIDITDTKVNEEKLKVLTAELNHRVKNTLAVVQGIARQTFPKGDLKTQAFLDRLGAFATVQELAAQSSWTTADFKELLERIVRMGPGTAFEIDPNCPKVLLNANVALIFALTFHELYTNAMKYGALSEEGGKVQIRWSLTQNPEELVIHWIETGGPEPEVTHKKGVGMTLIKEGFGMQTGGRADLEFAKEGLIVEFRAPQNKVIAKPVPS